MRRALPCQGGDNHQDNGGAGDLDGELGAFVEEQGADKDQRSPRERGSASTAAQYLLDALEAGPAARRFDDLVRDLAIGFAVELVVFAATRVGDGAERGAIQEA